VKIVIRRERWRVEAGYALARPGLRRRARRHFVLTLLACCHVAGATAADDSLARGRRLFETGIGANGQPVDAVFADSATAIAGTLLSCAGCHGRDGRGRSVKGIDPPDITWQNLTKPYALQARAGRSRLPYTEALVLRAIVTGRDSSNQLLGPAMPRFRLTPGDGADLVAYMRALGSTADPGITAQAIALGVVLPRREPEVHDTVRTALEAYRDEVNRAGGVFGRRISFAFIDGIAAPDPSGGGPPFDQTILAAVVGDGVDAARDVAALARRAVPLIAIRPDGDAPQPNVFYLGAGLPGELGALAAYAAREGDGGGRLAVLHDDNEAGRARVAALRALLARNGGPAIDAVPLAPGPDALTDEAMRRAGAGDVLLAGWDWRFAAILSRAARSNRLVLVPGSLIDARAPASGAPGRMLLAYETGAAPARRETGAAQVLAATRLLVEGLRRAGRDVSRARLVDAIETIQRFEVGHGAPVTFAPQRHVGFTGAQIMRFDPQQVPPMQPLSWIELD
jgi:ABC-type branched-subunit amino acid transport system substrate-binding protein